MAEAQLRQFLDKVRQLNAFVALSEADPQLRRELRDCEHHDQVVALARRCGFEIGRRWGEPLPQGGAVDAVPPSPELRPAGSVQHHTLGRVSGRSSPAQPGSAASAALRVDERLGGLLTAACPPPGEEVTDVLLETPLWRLERIHSCACSSPAGFWYEQQEEEWVLLLQGTATLRFADQPTDLLLQPGDSLWIRAGRRHRVTATDPAPGTIWLAQFWRPA